jgi:Leucine-rich repeat (LRR) protein
MATYRSIAEALQNPDDVTTLFLSRVDYKQFPPEIFLFKNLKILSMFGNNLKFMPKNIHELENLEELLISGNHISYIPKTIGEMKHLKKLILNNNQIERLPDSISQLKTLKILNVKGNKTIDLGEVAGKITSLEELNLSATNIKTIPENFRQLKRIKKLDLSYNDLVQLPKEIGNMISLNSLNLSFNKLESLPEELSKLVLLEELNLEMNHTLKKLPAAMGSLQNIKLINVNSTTLMRLICDKKEGVIEKFYDQLDKKDQDNKTRSIQFALFMRDEEWIKNNATFDEIFYALNSPMPIVRDNAMKYLEKSMTNPFDKLTKTLTIVLLGKFNKFDSTLLEKKLGSKINITSKVDKNLDYLVLSERPGKKFETALELGIPIALESHLSTILQN